MLTKYVLEIDGIDYELGSEDVMNWDEILCAYKRIDYSGVTRSFTSKFQFVNRAYELIIAAYMREGLKTNIVLKFFTITDTWEWTCRFEFPLDIASLSWTDYVLSVNCLDDSLASSIKARKGTKYEFIVGKDILVSETLEYDRIEMHNSCVHEIMGNGPTQKNACVSIVPSKELIRLPTYVIGEAETYENSPVLFSDETGDSGSFFLKIERPTSQLSLEIVIDFYNQREYFTSIINDAGIYLARFDDANPDINNSYQILGRVFKVNETSKNDWIGENRTCLGCFPSLAALKRAHPHPAQDVYAIIGKSSKPTECEAVYFTPITINAPTEWILGAKTTTGGRSNPRVICIQKKFISNFELSSFSAGSKFALIYQCTMTKTNPLADLVQAEVLLGSQIKTSWISRAKPIMIDAIQPQLLADALLKKISNDKLNIDTHFGESDKRLSKTYILAAESVRAIPGAKIYTTFSEFCDWMEAVFGYTYYLGPRLKARFKRVQGFFSEWSLSDSHLIHASSPGGHGNQVVLIQDTPYFAVLGDDYNEDGTLNFYTKWEGSDAYNDPVTGKARLDTLFHDELEYGYYFDSEYNLNAYNGEVNKGTLDSQSIYFVHRSELFDGNKVIAVKDTRDVQYSTNGDFIYSTVIAGYEKQEYETECGRDEWNFSAQYNTGVSLNDKKIELKSKYRADCYGLEFLAQERSKDTTDNKSDNTVFFVHCKIDAQTDSDSESRGDSDGDENSLTTTTLKIDRSIPISGALSNSVFNGEYSPYQCVKANEGYLSTVLKDCTLKFASFDGNTDVSVNGVKGNDDINLSSQLFTAGLLSFVTGDIDTPIDTTALYEVESNGVIYYGYLTECDIHFARTEAIKFKLIVKNIHL